jgi:hypothetical protein
MFDQQELIGTVFRDNTRRVMPQVAAIHPNQVLSELFKRHGELFAVDVEAFSIKLAVKSKRSTCTQ